MLEAMAAGLPLVVSDVSGVGEAFGDDECGIRVPPGEAPALAAAIRLLADQPQRRRDLGIAAKRRVAAEFDVQAMTARLASVYEQALAGRAGR
jgi:glycosyltransferase involved in cell wall biosynthesis